MTAVYPYFLNCFRGNGLVLEKGIIDLSIDRHHIACGDVVAIWNLDTGSIHLNRAFLIAQYEAALILHSADYSCQGNLALKEQ